MDDGVLVKLFLKPERATLDRVVSRFHLRADEIDRSFGLVPVKAESGAYAIRTTESAAQRMERIDPTIRRQSNPRIGVLGRERSVS